MAKKGKLDMQFVVDTKKPAKNIKELQTRIETLRDTIEGAPLGSEEFERLTGQLSNASSEMKVLEKNMEGLEPQQKAEAFLKMGEGIAGAFAVGQGAMALMGVESENMEKLQVKVQSAIAIATGIRMMSEAGLMMATAKRVAIEKMGMVATKAGIVWTKGIALAQGAWAVVQGILTGTIVGSTLALHALKAAIIATGIGALVVGIVSLVAAMASWNGSNKKTTKSTERLAKEMDKLKEKAVDQLNAARDLSDLNRELAKTDDEKEKKLLKINKAYTDLQKKLEDQVQVTDEAEKSATHLTEETRRLEKASGKLEKRYEGSIKMYDERVASGRKLEEQLKDEMDAQLALIKVMEQEEAAEEEAEEKRKEASSRYQKRKSDKAAAAESLRKLENELLLLEVQDLEERAQLKREQDLADELADAEKIRDKTIRLETLANIQDIYDQEEINRLQKIEDEKLKILKDAEEEQKTIDKAAQDERNKTTDAYLDEIRRKNLGARKAEIDIANKHFDEMMLAEGLTGDEKMQLLIDHQENIKAINKVYDDQELAVEDEKLAAKIEVLTSSLSAISANMNARVSELDKAMNRELEMEGVTEEQKEDIQKKFQNKKDAIAKRQKAIAASQAVIDTYVSATAAYKSMVGIPVVGPTLAPIAAGAAIAMGLANVRQIYAQDVGGGGGGGGGGASAPPAAASPKVGSFTLSGEAEKQDTIKAYVVTDDVTDSQSQLEDIRQQATI